MLLGADDTRAPGFSASKAFKIPTATKMLIFWLLMLMMDVLMAQRSGMMRDEQSRSPEEHSHYDSRRTPVTTPGEEIAATIYTADASFVPGQDMRFRLLISLIAWLFKR